MALKALASPTAKVGQPAGQFVAAIAAIEGALKRSGGKPSIVLVILSSGDKHVYSGLKKLCDTILDLRMWCLVGAMRIDI